MSERAVYPRAYNESNDATIKSLKGELEAENGRELLAKHWAALARFCARQVRATITGLDEASTRVLLRGAIRERAASSTLHSAAGGDGAEPTHRAAARAAVSHEGAQEAVKLMLQSSDFTHAQENVTSSEEAIDRLKAKKGRAEVSDVDHGNNSSTPQGTQTQLEKKLDTVIKDRCMIYTAICKADGVLPSTACRRFAAGEGCPGPSYPRDSRCSPGQSVFGGAEHV